MNPVQATFDTRGQRLDSSIKLPAYSSPPIFGDEGSLARYEAAYAAARDSALAAIVVAPRATLTSPTRGKLGPGAVVEMADLWHDRRVLDHLVRARVIIESSADDVQRRQAKAQKRGMSRG